MANDKKENLANTGQGNAQQLAIIKNDIVDVVASKVKQFINDKQLDLPADYSPENAMKAAWLQLQATLDKEGRPALIACTRDSIANALLDMVVQGLNPAKKHCYFIAYGNKLTLLRSYFGTAMVAWRALHLGNLFAEIFYDDDVLEYAIDPAHGYKVVTKHIQKLANINPDKMAGAYCCLTFKDGRPPYTEIMTIEQIRASWKKSKAQPAQAGSTHKEFPDQMAKRTVIARACKLAINMTSDNDLLIESYNRTSYNDEDPADLLAAAAAERANMQLIDIPAGEPDGPAGCNGVDIPVGGPGAGGQQTQQTDDPGIAGEQEDLQF